MRILLVEDDKRIAGFIAKGLTEEQNFFNRLDQCNESELVS